MEDEIQEKWITDKLIRRGLLKPQSPKKFIEPPPVVYIEEKKAEPPKLFMDLFDCLARCGTDK